MTYSRHNPNRCYFGTLAQVMLI